MTPKILHIAIAFDTNYSSVVYALLASIFWNQDSNLIAVHAIAPTVAEEEREELSGYVRGFSGNTITFYEIEENFGNDLLLPKSLWWTVSIYYRLLFPALLPPEVDKFIYLDTDIIVLKPLSGLLATDLGNKPVAAVNEKVGPPVSLGIAKSKGYFNSGVLLVNRPAWLEQNISQKTLDFVKQNADKLVNPDQDALNAVLTENWVALDSRFNLMFTDIPADLARKDYSSFLNNTVILHYTTQHKPWSMIGRNRLRHLYYYYLGKAPRKHRAYYADFTWNRHKVREMVEIRLMELAHDYPILNRLLTGTRS